MAGVAFSIGSAACRVLRAIGVATGDCYDLDGMVAFGGLAILLVIVAVGGVWVMVRR